MTYFVKKLIIYHEILNSYRQLLKNYCFSSVKMNKNQTLILGNE